MLMFVRIRLICLCATGLYKNIIYRWMFFFGILHKSIHTYSTLLNTFLKHTCISIVHQMSATSYSYQNLSQFEGEVHSHIFQLTYTASGVRTQPIPIPAQTEIFALVRVPTLVLAPAVTSAATRLR